MGKADIALRHLARGRPDGLARVFAPPGRAVEVVGWVDTQLTTLERRLDKALRLRIDGEPRILHVEFCFSLRPDLPARIFAYLGLLFVALSTESPDEPVPPIESVAVVLSGRGHPLPSTGRYRTGWPERDFSGTHFRIDAVYQRTLDELRARGNLFWLALSPLARDATAPKLREVLREIIAGAVSEREREDFCSAFFLMATIDPARQDLRKELVMLIEDDDDQELMSTPGMVAWLRESEERGAEKAISELLGRLFARRVGRSPTEDEERSILERSRAAGAGKVEDALLDLEREALLRWLAEPTPRS